MMDLNNSGEQMEGGMMEGEDLIERRVKQMKSIDQKL